MQTLKHFYRYLTDKNYRYWVKFCSREEHMERVMNDIIDCMKLQVYPMWYFTPDGGIKSTKLAVGDSYYLSDIHGDKAK